MRDLAAGRSYVSPGLAGRLLVAMRAANRREGQPNPLAELSKREEDILKLVAQGKSNRKWAQALDLQEKTVKHYMTSILQKLQVRNRVEAAHAGAPASEGLIFRPWSEKDRFFAGRGSVSQSESRG